MSQGKVLIVDDETGVCEAMNDLLDLKGYDVVTASNGVDGLKVCAENSIDLIILDLNMPRMDGYMFLEKLNERWENDGRRRPFPKVLVMTAVNTQTDLGLAKNLGASELMSKPFKKDEFLATVQRLLQP